MITFLEDEANMIRNMLVQALLTRVLIKWQHVLRMLAFDFITGGYGNGEKQKKNKKKNQN
jgi:hypothetical protein